MQPMQPPLVIKQGTSSTPVSMQPGMVSVPMTVNSSMPGSIPNVMTLNKPGGQNVVVTTQNLGTGQPAILPNVQILNMRPGAPTVAAQKSVATVSPRVVIGSPQVVGTRAAAPGITLQTLQSLQPGQQGHLLLKTENGQYQLLRVGPAPATSSLAAPPTQTIRLSTVPAHPGVATVSTSVAPPGVMPAQLQGALGSSAPHASASGAALAPAPPPPQHHQQPTTSTYVKPSDNTKEKCRNFLANLLDLSSKEPPSVEMNVRNLIQELIDAQVEPEEFCDRLERLLNASPQPCLIGFLKKSLPLLRQSLVTKELVIEGINPPAPHVAFATAPLPTPISAMASNNVQMTQPEVNVSRAADDDFVFKKPTKRAPQRKRSLSTSAISLDQQHFFSRNEGSASENKTSIGESQSATLLEKESSIAGHTNAAAATVEGTSSTKHPDDNLFHEENRSFLFAVQKKEVTAMMEGRDLIMQKHTLGSYFHSFLSEETSQKKETTEFHEIRQPSAAVPERSTEAAEAAEANSSENDSDSEVVTPEDMHFSFNPEKREKGNPLDHSVEIRDVTPPLPTEQVTDAVIEETSSITDSADISHNFMSAVMWPPFEDFLVPLGNDMDLDNESIMSRVSTPAVELSEGDVEVYEGRRIRHFNNFVQALAEELKKLPVIVAVRLELDIQQAVEAAKRIAYENKYIPPMTGSTISRLAGHVYVEGHSSDDE